MKKLLNCIRSIRTDQWLGLYGIYFCVMQYLHIIGDLWFRNVFKLYALVPLILLGSIQLIRKKEVISVMYSIPVVILICLIW
jgi:hypothetical protein